jgi:hypothetical protein
MYSLIRRWGLIEGKLRTALTLSSTLKVRICCMVYGLYGLYMYVLYVYVLYVQAEDCPDALFDVEGTCVCLCVCVCVYVYVCVYVCVYVYVLYVYVYVLYVLYVCVLYVLYVCVLYVCVLYVCVLYVYLMSVYVLYVLMSCCGSAQRGWSLPPSASLLRLPPLTPHAPLSTL